MRKFSMTFWRLSMKKIFMTIVKERSTVRFVMKESTNPNHIVFFFIVLAQVHYWRKLKYISGWRTSSEWQRPTRWTVPHQQPTFCLDVIFIHRLKATLHTTTHITIIYWHESNLKNFCDLQWCCCTFAKSFSCSGVSDVGTDVCLQLLFSLHNKPPWECRVSAKQPRQNHFFFWHHWNSIVLTHGNVHQYLCCVWNWADQSEQSHLEINYQRSTLEKMTDQEKW
jgi:hypothetical protein